MTAAVQWLGQGEVYVAAKMQQIEPKAMFTHCYGHALNLSVNDTIKGSPTMKAQEKIACILDVCCQERSQETPVWNFLYVSWE